MAKRILIVEDDPSIRFGLEEVLRGDGYQVVSVDRGDSVVESALKQANFDLIVLDVMLPGRNGYAACRDLREAGLRIPILMLTAKGQEMDKVTGLDSGADDYLTKPFGLKELLARVHALLRRAAGHLPTAGSEEYLMIGECRIDVANHVLERDGQTEILTPKELCLIQCLHRHRGKALTREQLLNEVWGVQYFGTTRTLDQTVAQVRRKIGDSGGTPRWIVTVHGVGYRLN